MADTVPSARGGAAASPDAELIRLCAAWHRFQEAIEAVEAVLDCPKAMDAAAAEGDLRDRIWTVRPTTFQGVAAKARIVHRLHGDSGDLNTFTGELHQATLGLIPDLVALADGAAA
jgi:hypothetical protein